MIKLQTAFLSKAGGRTVNQDYCHYEKKNGYSCYILADGLGGHQRGDLASKTAGEAVLSAFIASPGLSAKGLKGYVEHARHSFWVVQNEAQPKINMKATLVVLLIDGYRALWGHVGDSRLYYFHSGSLHFQTRDHSVPQRLADSGEIRPDQIRFHEDRNRLIASFDGKDISRFEILEKPIEMFSGDAFLLCSDGFWEYLLEQEMEADLQGAGQPDKWIKLMEDRLLMRVEKKHDNYSAVAIMASN